MSPPSTLADLVVLFALGVAVVTVFHRLRLAPIVGFLITGVLAGPFGFGLIRNVERVRELAEVGVILLLFTIGLEYSLGQLSRMRSFLLIGGGLQVGLTLGATALLARVFDATWPVAIFLGMLVALSSTAIVLRLLADRAELETPYGKAALGILIFQDLCIVPMILITPALAGQAGGAGSIIVGLLEAALFVVGAVVAARFVVPRLLHAVASTRRRDLFILTIALICLGTAWISALAGLSLALGAFLAGLVISESDYSHQALGEVLPLREVFNSLFFISIGMLFDVRIVLGSPLVIAGALGSVVLIKTLVTGGVSLALGHSIRVATVTALALAQIGEFSFVLAQVGLTTGLLTQQFDQLFLAVAVGSMAIAPGLIALAPRIAGAVEARTPRRWLARRYGVPGEGTDPPHIEDHVVIVGFGFNGRNLARVLKSVEIPYVVIELNPAVVRAERRAGEPILYGDAASAEILRHAGIERARVLVIAISDAAATRATVSAAKRLTEHVHIMVRTHYVREMHPLRDLGTAEVIPEEFETSIEIFSRVLRRYLVPREAIERTIRDVRHEHYEMYRTLPDTATRVEEIGRFLTDVTLAVFRVEHECSLGGASLAEARLRDRSGATVVAIQRRKGGVIPTPHGQHTLEEGDTVLLLGTPEQLAHAGVLLRGRSEVIEGGSREQEADSRKDCSGE
jgi:CPA2 family monovalent cation:H+ antiporter-2